MHYILTLLLLTSYIYAKTADFSIIIDEKFNNALVDVAEDYDRSISAVGFIKEYKDGSSNASGTYTNAFDYLSSLSNAHGSQMHLVKVDNSANISLRKSMNLANFNEAVSLVKTPENGYFIECYTPENNLHFKIVLNNAHDTTTVVPHAAVMFNKHCVSHGLTP